MLLLLKVKKSKKSYNVAAALRSVFNDGECACKVGIKECGIKKLFCGPPPFTIVSPSPPACLLNLLRRFWNQILTCVSVNFKLFASCDLSGGLKYRFTSNVNSNCVT